jgi:hypothetical protein
MSSLEGCVDTKTVGPQVWRSILDFLRSGKTIPYEQPRYDVNAFFDARRSTNQRAAVIYRVNG